MPTGTVMGFWNLKVTDENPLKQRHIWESLESDLDICWGCYW